MLHRCPSGVGRCGVVVVDELDGTAAEATQVPHERRWWRPLGHELLSTTQIAVPQIMSARP